MIKPVRKITSKIDISKSLGHLEKSRSKEQLESIQSKKILKESSFNKVQSQPISLQKNEISKREFVERLDRLSQKIENFSQIRISQLSSHTKQEKINDHLYDTNIIKDISKKSVAEDYINLKKIPELKIYNSSETQKKTEKHLSKIIENMDGMSHNFRLSEANVKNTLEKYGGQDF